MLVATLRLFIQRYLPAYIPATWRRRILPFGLYIPEHSADTGLPRGGTCLYLAYLPLHIPTPPPAAPSLHWHSVPPSSPPATPPARTPLTRRYRLTPCPLLPVTLTHHAQRHFIPFPRAPVCIRGPLPASPSPATFMVILPAHTTILIICAETFAVKPGLLTVGCT